MLRQDRIDLALDKALAERSLHEFFRQSWHITTPGHPLCDGWHLQAIAEHLEAVYKGQIKDLLVLVPPRCGKTLLVSICFPAWVWINRPEAQFVCASYGQDLSNDQSIECRRLMNSSWYRARWGFRWQFTGDANRVTEVKNNRNGFRMATSTKGRATGRGGDIRICDDPHNIADVVSPGKIEDVHTWWRTVWSTRMNSANAGTITVMQRVCSTDLASRIIEEGAEVLEIPMEWHEDVRPWPLDRLSHQPV